MTKQAQTIPDWADHRKAGGLYIRAHEVIVHVHPDKRRLPELLLRHADGTPVHRITDDVYITVRKEEP